MHLPHAAPAVASSVTAQTAPSLVVPVEFNKIELELLEGLGLPDASLDEQRAGLWQCFESAAKETLAATRPVEDATDLWQAAEEECQRKQARQHLAQPPAVCGRHASRHWKERERRRRARRAQLLAGAESCEMTRSDGAEALLPPPPSPPPLGIVKAFVAFAQKCAVAFFCLLLLMVVYTLLLAQPMQHVALGNVHSLLYVFVFVGCLGIPLFDMPVHSRGPIRRRWAKSQCRGRAFDRRRRKPQRKRPPPSQAEAAEKHPTSLQQPRRLRRRPEPTPQQRQRP